MSKSQVMTIYYKKLDAIFFSIFLDLKQNEVKDILRSVILLHIPVRKTFFHFLWF